MNNTDGIELLSLPKEQYDHVVMQLRRKKRFFMRFTDGDSATFFKSQGKILAKKPDGQVRELILLTEDMMLEMNTISARGAFIQECVRQGMPLEMAIVLADTIFN